MITPTYVDVISRYYPEVHVTAGVSDAYEDLTVLVGELPDKATLDAQRHDFLCELIWRDIQVIRDTRRLGGVKINDTHWFHSDDTSRIQQIGLVMFGANMPTGIMWKTMTGDFVQMTPALAMAVFTGIASNDASIFAIAEQHRQAMIAAEDPTTYVFTTGWPQIYADVAQ